MGHAKIGACSERHQNEIIAKVKTDRYQRSCCVGVKVNRKQPAGIEHCWWVKTPKKQTTTPTENGQTRRDPSQEVLHQELQRRGKCDRVILFFSLLCEFQLKPNRLCGVHLCAAVNVEVDSDYGHSCEIGNDERQ